jgi:hypothetical protein
MLELRKLMDEVETMSREMAGRQQELGARAAEARQKLVEFAVVDDALLDKIDRAAKEDLSWRGAFPVGPRLDERHRPEAPPVDASLIGVDGSQIYPDRHGLAIYYLVNTGAIVLRQGSGEAPATSTRPSVFYRHEDIYDDDQELVDNRVVNAARETAEMKEMVRQAREERAYWGGDLDRLVVALSDGPLLIWLGEKEMDAAVRQRIRDYIDDLQALETAGVAPIGYVDRSHLASVLRMLDVAQLELREIRKERLRNHRYQGLTDRLLFDFLAPNERSAIFSSTAKVNRDDLNAADQEIHFFYLNVARKPGPDEARIVRIDAPNWLTARPDWLDQVQQAIYRDCEGTEYPYVLARAHELALVSFGERQDFEHMLSIAMMRNGMLPESSQKAFLKHKLAKKK